MSSFSFVSRRFVQRLSVAGASLLLAGCVQLSPQQVAFEPALTTGQLISGQGTMSIDVLDQRASKVIGYRGGVYKDTSTIVSKYSLEQTIRQISEKAMQSAGFELSTMLAELNAEISLTELSYESVDYKPSIKRTTTAAAVRISVRKDNTTFSNSYRTSQYADTVGYPTEEKNAEMLNAVLESVLQRMFSDPALEQFVAQ